MQSELLGVADLCRTFGVTRQTIGAWVRCGKLPSPLKISRRTVRWTRDSIEQALRRLAGGGELRADLAPTLTVEAK
jgi:predicted DNA-binding transcriptional regulator AlpA